MKNDIYSLVNYFHSCNIKYIGNHTTNANGDLIVDDKIVELKYTNGSLGTYFNTSTEYFSCLGFITLSNYLKQQGYFNKLKEMGIEVNDNNVSPVNIITSKDIRYNRPKIYQEIKRIESIYRKKYTKMLYEFLLNNQEACAKCVKDLITKEESNKEIPDRLVVFDHDTKVIREITKQEILTCGKTNEIQLNGYTIKLPKFHFTIAWQNGTGLNNPTIRVFLD